MTPRGYGRRSAFYFCYFAATGLFMPWWPLYLASCRLRPSQVGLLMALLGFTRVFSPSLWGALVDRTGRLQAVLRLLAGGSVATFALIFLRQDFAWLLLVMALFGFFWNALLPLAEMATLHALGGQPAGYGRIRLWGSVGFIVVAVAIGSAPARIGASHLPLLAVLLLGLCLASTWRLPQTARQVPASRPGAWAVLRRPAVLALTLACCLMAVAHGAFYTFFTVDLLQHGYARWEAGCFWALGVLAEILLFWSFPHLARRFSLKQILVASFALAALRFALMAWGVAWPALVVLVQVLHAASFGAYHAAAVTLYYRLFAGHSPAAGQALYNGFAYGTGNALGSLYGGYAWQWLGPAGTFGIAALCALAGCLLVGRWAPASEPVAPG